MKHLIFWATLVIILSIGACIESFDPDLRSYQDTLVVEGYVREGEVPAWVRLSRTTGVGSSNSDTAVVQGAQVLIQNDQGQQIDLPEVAPGIYESDSSALPGTPGHAYQLVFWIDGGEKYESDWMTMKAGHPISEVEAAYEERLGSDVGDSLRGMQFYISTEDPEGKTRYYRWECEETWEFIVPYPARSIWDPATMTATELPLEEYGWVCWKTIQIPQIMLTTTDNLEADIVNRFPLIYVSSNTNRLSRKYSLLINQYSINRETFAYWQSLSSMNENLGTLFDPIPTELVGNIRNVDDPKEPVIGFFSADGMSTKRIFIERGDLPLLAGINSGYKECKVDTFDNIWDLNVFVSGGGAFLDTIYNDFGFFGGWTGSQRQCTDCKLRGTNQKPDFWE